MKEKRKDKIRIVFLEHLLNNGGAERVSISIIRNLPLSKFEIYLICTGKAGELRSEIPNTIELIELGSTHTKNAFFRYIVLISRLKPDVVYASLFRVIVLAILGKLMCNYKVIARFPTMPALEKSISVGKARSIIYKIIVRYADQFIAQTAEMLEAYHTEYKIKRAKILVLNNPIDGSFINSKLQNAKNPYSEKKINLVAVGSIYMIKDYITSIETLDLLVKQDTRYFLNIIGGTRDRDYRTSLESLIIELKLEKNIKFWGFHENPYPFVRFADVFILTSKLEGMPNSLLEAIFLRKPVVATACVPIVRQIIEQGVNGYVCPIEDKYSLSRAITKCQYLEIPKVSNKLKSIDQFISKFVVICQSE